MKGVIGIRREDLDRTERRAPLTPTQVKELIEKHQILVKVESNPSRIFPDSEYAAVGAEIQNKLSQCNIIFGVKEIPITSLLPNQAYCFFSHTIKGQVHNMPMLKSMLDLQDTLIDYEKINNDDGQRLIFFGHYAGYAGMIDTIWTLGLRLAWEGHQTPFKDVLQASQYKNLSQARQQIKRVGDCIENEGIPETLSPLIIGFAGYGQVSKGAQKIFDLLPFEQIEPKSLKDFVQQGDHSNRKIYKVVFKESDMVLPKASGKSFNLKEYINGIYWEPKYPRLVTKKSLSSLFEKPERLQLRVIGDISCDIEGAIECTMKATNLENPIFLYDPINDDISDGFEGRGVVMLAFDKLPSELPVEASVEFGTVLLPFVPSLARADYEISFADLHIPQEFRRAVVAHKGRLTPDYEYLFEYISGTQERRHKV
jgi:alpha-aminoadipic semialdehyde synthase